MRVLGACRADQVPNKARRARFVESSDDHEPTDEFEDMSPCGAIGAVAPSEIGASACITRSGGKVTTTPVPIRSFDFSVKVPPCRSIRFLAIGSPRPAPCSADLIEFEP